MSDGNFDIDGRTLAEIISAIFMAIVSWIWVDNRQTIKEHGKRLGKLEVSAVTREEFEESLQEQLSTLRAERSAMHAENKERFDETKSALQRIEAKMEAGVVQAQGIALQVAVLATKVDGNRS